MDSNQRKLSHGHLFQRIIWRKCFLATYRRISAKICHYCTRCTRNSFLFWV